MICGIFDVEIYREDERNMCEEACGGTNHRMFGNKKPHQCKFDDQFYPEVANKNIQNLEWNSYLCRDSSVPDAWRYL